MRVFRTKFKNKLHDTTSNKKNFPSEEQLTEISKYSFKKTKHIKITNHILKKLEGPQKKWRKILKTFYLLENLIQKGSLEIFVVLTKNVEKIQKYFDYKFIEENNIDRGIKSILISTRNGETNFCFS